MSLTVKDILEMKNHTNNLGMNVYDWFFIDLENNYLSKMNGTKRNLAIIERYNEEAQSYIIYQLLYVNEDAANALMKELNINDLTVSNENKKQIIKA